jgi:hypothetical protein
MIWGGDVKKPETRLSHWERVHKEYRLEINPEKTVMSKLLRNAGKNTAVNVNGKEIKRSSYICLLGECDGGKWKDPK